MLEINPKLRINCFKKTCGYCEYAEKVNGLSEWKCSLFKCLLNFADIMEEFMEYQNIIRIGDAISSCTYRNYKCLEAERKNEKNT